MEFRTSVPSTLGFAALGVVMTSVSYFAAVNASGVRQIAGWVGVFFFGLGTVVIALQLFRRGPVVVIDDSGVLDRRLGVGLIPWQDISSVSITTIRSQRFISLWLRNEEPYLSRWPVWRRAGSGFSEKLGFSPFSMQFKSLTPGLDEAYARLKENLPERAGF